MLYCANPVITLLHNGDKRSNNNNQGTDMLGTRVKKIEQVGYVKHSMKTWCTLQLVGSDMHEDVFFTYKHEHSLFLLILTIPILPQHLWTIFNFSILQPHCDVLNLLYVTCSVRTFLTLIVATVLQCDRCYEILKCRHTVMCMIPQTLSPGQGFIQVGAWDLPPPEFSVLLL